MTKVINIMTETANFMTKTTNLVFKIINIMTKCFGGGRNGVYLLSWQKNSYPKKLCYDQKGKKSMTKTSLL